MKLFEITTGEIGYSYVRAYAWAEDDRHALFLFRAKNPSKKPKTIFCLLDASGAAFCTATDSNGWAGSDENLLPVEG